MNNYFKISSVFIFVALFFSCLAHSQNNTNSSINELEKTNAKLTSSIDALKLKIKEDTTQSNLLVDSLLGEITRLQSFLAKDSLYLNDSLRYIIDSLSKRISAIENVAMQLESELHQVKQQYSEVFQVAGTQAIQIRTRQSEYDCYKVNLKETNLALFWQNEKGQPLRNIDSLQKYLARQGHQLIFAMNAGMYKPGNSPQGLYVQEGKALISIDRKKEAYGNFYMQPNGVFSIDTANTANIIITDHYDSTELKKTVFATQSGPMALINGIINEKFNIDSNSKHIRNGVGIIDKHNIVFVISNKRVNLYDFANVFKAHFKCSNALYLDGAISRMYLPEIQRLQKGGDFGPLIGIYK